MNWKRLGRYLIAAFATTCGWAGMWWIRYGIENAIYPDPNISAWSAIRLVLAAVLKVAIDSIADEIIAHALGWFIGGLSIGIGLRLINHAATWRSMLLIAFGWMVGAFIWIFAFRGPIVTMPDGNGQEILWSGYLQIGVFAAALLTGLIVLLHQPLASSWQPVAITLGWFVARLLVGINYLDWWLPTGLAHLVRGCIFGLVGSAIMYTTLYLTKWDQAANHRPINPIATLLRDQPISAQLLKNTQRSASRPQLIMVGTVIATLLMLACTVIFAIPRTSGLPLDNNLPLSVVLVISLVIAVLIGVTTATLTYERIVDGKLDLLSLTGVRGSTFILSMARAAFQHQQATFIGLAFFALIISAPAVFVSFDGISITAWQANIPRVIWSLIGGSYMTLGALALSTLALIIGVVITWINRSQIVGLMLTTLITVFVGGLLIAQALNVLLVRYWFQQTVALLIMLPLIPYLLSSVILTRIVARDEAANKPTSAIRQQSDRLSSSF